MIADPACWQVLVTACSAGMMRTKLDMSKDAAYASETLAGDAVCIISWHAQLKML